MVVRRVREVRVEIDLWCDHHGKPTRATVTRTLTIDRSRPKSLDLCDACDGAHVQWLAALLKKAGIDPDPNTQAEPETCPVEDCGEVLRNRRSLAAHIRAAHKRSIKEFTGKGKPLPASSRLRTADGGTVHLGRSA